MSGKLSSGFQTGFCGTIVSLAWQICDRLPAMSEPKGENESVIPWPDPNYR